MGSFLGWLLGFFGAAGVALGVGEFYKRYTVNSLRRKIEKAYTD